MRKRDAYSLACVLVEARKRENLGTRLLYGLSGIVGSKSKKKVVSGYSKQVRSQNGGPSLVVNIFGLLSVIYRDFYGYSRVIGAFLWNS